MESLPGEMCMNRIGDKYENGQTTDKKNPPAGYYFLLKGFSLSSLPCHKHPIEPGSGVPKKPVGWRRMNSPMANVNEIHRSVFDVMPPGGC